ncbi:co-regulatory protein PtrA N-terminal domain-containing protein [Pseudomonas protegens]|uniref:co-regulatory protein PtrA N-terminal domain-containing protein n=1 Tax=Pseudomonas protegens TaxID=380021 RepID=UPI002281469B|nr:co-regulatory protein PtrA N-terminal domain-containing protein [Pseudomonas protegens]MCY7261873.1 hypothetical protein [Pseudomonas protegens]
MSFVKVSSLAILFMLPVVSQAEGGGDRVIGRYEKMRDAQLAERAKISEQEQSVAEKGDQNTEKNC